MRTTTDRILNDSIGASLVMFMFARQVPCCPIIFERRQTSLWQISPKLSPKQSRMSNSTKDQMHYIYFRFLERTAPLKRKVILKMYVECIFLWVDICKHTRHSSKESYLTPTRTTFIISLHILLPKLRNNMPCTHLSSHPVSSIFLWQLIQSQHVQYRTTRRSTRYLS